MLEIPELVKNNRKPDAVSKTTSGSGIYYTAKL